MCDFNKIGKAGAICALISSFLSLGGAFSFTSPAWAEEVKPDVQALEEPAVRSVNHFTLQAARLLAPGGENFFFSPYSIISALGMTYAGAKEETAGEMEKSLLFSPLLHGSLGALTQDLSSETGKNSESLTMANRIWLNKGLGIHADFAETLRRHYGSTAAEVDFKKDPSGSKKEINSWVEEQTHERIRDLIQKIDPDTQMILVNAIYFNGRWENPFSENRTSPKPFHVTDSKTKDVPMMQQNRRLLYGEVDDVKLLRLPYKGRLSMLLALPKKGVGVEEMLKALAEDSRLFDRWTRSLSRYEVDLWLPKFRTESRYELKDVLTALGVRQAFEKEADFSGITDDEKLRIDSVIHKTFIEVDEKKTEAAAATGIIMVRTTAVAPDSIRRAEFHADRPFLYFIVDDATRIILFAGRQSFK
ncbi:MAG: serpin family protein [Fretibacterium sp.]|nr:serpin family protein [Fretibacterium sp.]